MEPVATICIKSVDISPQEIIVTSQNIQCGCHRGERTAHTKSKCYLIPGTSSNQCLALLAESSLHFNSEARTAAAKGEKGQRAREEQRERSELSETPVWQTSASHLGLNPLRC